MAQNIRRMIRAAVVSVWTMVKNLSYHIFFRKPIELHKHRGLQYHHLKTTYVYFFAFIIVPFYFVPWVGLAVWYIAIVKACEHQFTRDYVEAVCIQSQLGITNKSMPWYLDLWNSQADNSRYFDSLSPSIEAIMTSHLPLYDAQIELLTHSSKLNGMLSATPVFDELLGSLESVISMISNLASQQESFSETFCLQRDTMITAFRSFVETYAMAITASNHQAIPLASFFLFPAKHMVIFINHLFEVPWLPQPRLYSLQVKSEIRFRKKRFIAESIEALDTIDKRSPANRHIHDSPNLILGVAINSATLYELLLERRIAGFSYWQRWVLKPPDFIALGNAHALSKRIRRLILMIMEMTKANEAYSRRLRSQLQQVRQIVRGDPSFRSSSAVPKYLPAQGQRSPFFVRQQRLRARNSSVDTDSTEVTPHSQASLEDLDAIDGATVSSYRSMIAQVCMNRKHGEIISGVLHMVCLIHTFGATMSEIDDDALGSHRRSWVVERHEAIRRYQAQTGTDLDSIIDLAVEMFQAHQKSAPMPEF